MTERPNVRTLQNFLDELLQQDVYQTLNEAEKLMIAIVFYGGAGSALSVLKDIKEAAKNPDGSLDEAWAKDEIGKVHAELKAFTVKSLIQFLLHS